MNRLAKWLRIFVLAGLLAYVTYAAYMHQVLGGGKAPSVHALCPFGALESLYALLFAQNFIQKIYSGTVVLLILTVVLAILFRRGFCGLLCPFGALQEAFAIISQKIFHKRFIMPEKIDQPLRFVKYGLLLLTIGLAWYYEKLWMSPYDPYSAYAHLSTFSETLKEEPQYIVGFVLLAITILGSFLYDRFFCKYLCPMGAFYGIIGKISPTKIERNDNLCINCKACSRACPVNIDVNETIKVTHAECINCNECVLACTKKGALEIKTAKRTVQPVAMLVTVVTLFFGIIFTAQLTGNYQTIPLAIKEGQVVDISQVKGYYTIEEAAKSTGLALDEVYQKLDIPPNISKNTRLKEIINEVPGYRFDDAKAKASGSVISGPVNQN